MGERTTRAEIKHMTKGVVDRITSSAFVMNVVYPGAGDLFIDVLAEEIQKLRDTSNRHNCCNETAGRGSDMDSVRKEKTVLYFDFGTAIQAVKQGKNVARKGWNGKNQFVELATCISYKGNAGEIVNCHHNNIGNKALAFVGTSGIQMGWLASQADMLAEDWYIVE